MATTKKERLEFDLPNVLIQAITQRLGTAITSKLRPDQAQALMNEAWATSIHILEIIASPEGSDEIVMDFVTVAGLAFEANVSPRQAREKLREAGVPHEAGKAWTWKRDSEELTIARAALGLSEETQAEEAPVPEPPPPD